MGILRIKVDVDRRSRPGAKLYVSVKGTAAVMGNAAVKWPGGAGLVATLAQAGERRQGRGHRRRRRQRQPLGRSQSVEITLSDRRTRAAARGAGILSDQSSVSLDTLEWVYETFEASIP